MKKLIFIFIMLIPILMSCEEDEDKVIQTDLPTEADQLFSISTDWSESLYFAMISWEEYQQMDTVGLPSCPDIIINEDTKEITLNFLGTTACVQSGEYDRSGKLIIKFDTTAQSPNKNWTMEYEDYQFGSNALEGIRNFSSDDSLQILEEFTEIIERTENDLSTEFSGKYIHTKTYVIDSLTTDSLTNDSLLISTELKSFSSVGSIKGVNAAGRAFEITIDNPITHSISCYQQNEILPNTGKENWFVSRGGNSEVNYSTTYEQLLEDCKVAVNTILPDGRKLLLNPGE
ncbi:hypothetical protein SYJ56_12090 [Algoriphagus sp. D3-2-R+10]|uniref:hypothetical protein n=1 Tax=Algoriphagus aurantiacus TaxID=3103948 RepID=UPI002B377C58|nr:hypothetical protein [Algoriphagus sp. D3-2-R+10]MEB2776053.1 hypothetical protein [Algoriphagus sp. D3-2-R+10]